MTLSIASCAGGAATDTFCLTQSPHRFSDKAIDAMDAREKAVELEFNRYGEQRCGWQP